MQKGEPGNWLAFLISACTQLKRMHCQRAVTHFLFFPNEFNLPD